MRRSVAIIQIIAVLFFVAALSQAKPLDFMRDLKQRVNALEAEIDKKGGTLGAFVENLLGGAVEFLYYGLTNTIKIPLIILDSAVEQSIPDVDDWLMCTVFGDCVN